MDHFSQFRGVEYKFGSCSLKLGVWPKIKCKFPPKCVKCGSNMLSVALYLLSNEKI